MYLLLKYADSACRTEKVWNFRKRQNLVILAIGAAEKAKKNLHTLCGLSSHQRKKASRTTHKGKVQDFVQLRKFHTFSRRYFESAC